MSGTSSSHDRDVLLFTASISTPIPHSLQTPSCPSVTTVPVAQDRCSKYIRERSYRIGFASLPLLVTLPPTTLPTGHPSSFTMQAAPSYTSVAARQTLQRPAAPPADASAAQKVGWSPEVRDYVQRSFDRTNLRSGITAKEMQDKLKVVITNAAETGQMQYIDWSTYPLPQDLIHEERERAALQSGANGNMTNTYSSIPTGLDGASSPDQTSRKRKTPDTETEPQEGSTPPWRQKVPKNGLQDRITGKSKKEEKKQKKSNNMRANGVDNSMDAVAKRRQRFGYVTPELSPYESSRDQSPEPPTGPIVGTCQTLEKNYFRLTAPPPPNVVRPLDILEKALDLVRQKWKTDHNYRYACDQLKSIRQDLTVQHVKNEFTVKVYEAHARIALEMSDLGEYNQCQTQLRALYKLNLGGNPEEFMAYRILYIIYTCNRVDMNDVLADLTPADKRKPGVKHALKVRAALASGNYHMFFRLYDEAPFMGPYLLDMFLERERLAALAAICRA